MPHSSLSRMLIVDSCAAEIRDSGQRWRAFPAFSIVVVDGIVTWTVNGEILVSTSDPRVIMGSIDFVDRMSRGKILAEREVQKPV